MTIKKYNTPLTQSQIKLIEKLGEKGMPDVKIANQMNISYQKVAVITTDFWKRKMKEKK